MTFQTVHPDIAGALFWFLYSEQVINPFLHLPRSWANKTHPSDTFRYLQVSEDVLSSSK